MQLGWTVPHSPAPAGGAFARRPGLRRLSHHAAAATGYVATHLGGHGMGVLVNFGAISLLLRSSTSMTSTVNGPLRNSS